MISSLLNREVDSICRSVVRFLDVTVSRAMGCFFDCFRIRDNRARITHTTRPKQTEPVISKNRLSSLFSAEEKEEYWSNDIENQHFETPQFDKRLKDEAKFLKACGTLVETPAEIRKASQKLKGSPPADEKDSESSKLHSWLPNTSSTKLQLEREYDQSPSPIKLAQEWEKESSSLDRTPSSCISNAQNTGSISISSTDCSVARNANMAVKVHANQADGIASVPPWISSTNARSRNKSVRFECDSDASSSKDSSSGNIIQNSGKYESPANLSVSKNSPNPTPLNLSDDMQTPGTVFPTNLKSLADGNTRIRSQYLYSVRNPVENVSQLRALEEEGLDSHELSGELRESIESLENATPKSEAGIEENSAGKELKVEASLSAWLKPAASATLDGIKNLGVSSSKNPHFGRNPGDRPIIGMVAAHWNEDESPQIGPKWWDGNGIPNSTNKYKEDQKVSWHATPFEERLEKALSEESFISQRNNIKETPMIIDDSEETDTAISQLQPAPHSKSVVSY